MDNNELRKLADEIADLEFELQQEKNERRKTEIEKEIIFKSENPELSLMDYLELDDLIYRRLKRKLK